jgi:hypothetical protein
LTVDDGLHPHLDILDRLHLPEHGAQYHHIWDQDSLTEHTCVNNCWY